MMTQERPMQKLALTAWVLAFALPAMGQDSPKICDDRRQAIRSGNNELITCGTSKCPESVKYEATVGDPATLPKGWFVYYHEGALYTSDFRAFNAKKVSNTGPVMREKHIFITDDGQRILYGEGSERQPTLIRRDGSGKKTSDLSGTKFTPLRGQNKVAHMSVGAGLVEWTSGFEVKSNEQILVSKFDFASAKNLGGRQTSANRVHHSWLSAAGDYLFTTLRQSPSVIYGKGKSDYPAVLYRISGSAEKPVNVNPLYPFSCGLTISWDGKYTAANYGNAYQDCVPENHKGFVIIPTKVAGQGKPEDWLSLEGVSVNWCPADYKGFDLRAGTNDKAEFHEWNFTNHSDWILGVRRFGEPIGIWLVNWRNNVWYPVSDDGTKADMVAAYFEETPGPTHLGSFRDKGAAPATIPTHFDLLGRETQSETNFADFNESSYLIR